MIVDYELKIKIIVTILDYLELIDTEDSIKIIDNIMSIDEIDQLKDYILDLIIVFDMNKNIFNEIKKILENNT